MLDKQRSVSESQRHGSLRQLDEVEIVLADDVVRVKGTIPNSSLVELTVANGYVAALVVEGAKPRLTYYVWKWPSKSGGVTRFRPEQLRQTLKKLGQIRRPVCPFPRHGSL